jgi:hypothetical protein
MAVFHNTRFSDEGQFNLIGLKISKL